MKRVPRINSSSSHAEMTVLLVWKVGTKIYRPASFISRCRFPENQLFPYENHCECYKKLASQSWPVLFTITYFFSYICTLLFYWKMRSCCDHHCPQQIRLQTNVQLGDGNLIFCCMGSQESFFRLVSWQNDNNP